MNHRIEYEHFKLDNGLEVILQADQLRPFVVVSVLYKVGSKNDPPHRTGLAHLFEHLMFAGSQNVDSFDDQLHRAGGENNAYTTSDYTLYYNTLPAENLETALWLESDRMNALNFNEKTLLTQQKVVVEEFKETCLEEPYGDSSHHLYDLAYKAHPYRWPVIGKNFTGIEATTLEEIKDFFYRYYRPNNAILSLCGNFDPQKAKQLITDYFGNIPSGTTIPEDNFPKEEVFFSPRCKKVIADVPSTAIYIAFPIPERLHPDFYALDVLAFLLGGGKSSRLYKQLVREQKVFHSLETDMNDMFDSGLFIIEGHVDEEADSQTAIQQLLFAIEQLNTTSIQAEELEKVLNKLTVRNNYSGISLVNRGGELCISAALGDIEIVNTDSDRYKSVTIDDLKRCIEKYLRPERRIQLIYEPENLA